MEIKILKIEVPQGYEVDKEQSTFEQIVFKKIEKETWESVMFTKKASGSYIDLGSNIVTFPECKRFFIEEDKNVFKTNKQAKSALAYAQLTQLMALDKYNGDWKPVWNDGNKKYVINYNCDKIILQDCYYTHSFLAFKEETARDEFYRHHEDLIKQFYMVD